MKQSKNEISLINNNKIMKNKNSLNILSKILITLFSFFSIFASNAQDFNAKLWYDYPATDWKTQSLHIGSGFMGHPFMAVCKKSVSTSLRKHFALVDPVKTKITIMA